jgi:hypothetical protein
MTAEPLIVNGPHLVFHSQRIQGFWAVNWLRSQTSFDKLAAIYDELAPMMAAGVISSPVAGSLASSNIAKPLQLHERTEASRSLSHGLAHHERRALAATPQRAGCRAASAGECSLNGYNH